MKLTCPSLSKSLEQGLGSMWLTYVITVYYCRCLWKKRYCRLRLYIYIQLYCSRLELVKLALNPLLLLPLSASLRRKEKLRVTARFLSSHDSPTCLVCLWLRKRERVSASHHWPEQGKGRTAMVRKKKVKMTFYWDSPNPYGRELLHCRKGSNYGGEVGSLHESRRDLPKQKQASQRFSSSTTWLAAASLADSITFF